MWLENGHVISWTDEDLGLVPLLSEINQIGHLLISAEDAVGDETIDNQQTTCSDALTNCSNALSTQNMSCIVDYWVDLGPIDCLKACNNGHMFTLGPPKTCLEIRLRKFDSTFGFSTTSLGKNRSVSGGGSCCVLSELCCLRLPNAEKRSLQPRH